MDDEDERALGCGYHVEGRVTKILNSRLQIRLQISFYKLTGNVTEAITMRFTAMLGIIVLLHNPI